MRVSLLLLSRTAPPAPLSLSRSLRICALSRMHASLSDSPAPPSRTASAPLSPLPLRRQVRHRRQRGLQSSIVKGTGSPRSPSPRHRTPSSLPCRRAAADSPPPGHRLSPAATSPRSPSPSHRSAPPPTRCAPSRIHRHPIWPLCLSRQLALAPSRRLAPSLPVAVAPHQVVADPIADRSPSGLHQIAAAPPDNYLRQSL
ncbi:hypothetical protein DAI22_06g196600 [Oryza sativa Japonica Group]|nr:hypothetical protein DAI22_06g196600 [Oryza sativa Japonica Group]